MSELTPEEILERTKVIMSGIHEPCGMPHEFGKGCTEAWALFSIRAAEQRGRLAGWEEAREACLKVIRSKSKKLPKWFREFVETLEALDAIAALTPPTKGTP